VAQITQEFNEPFNQGTSTLPTEIGGSVVGVDGRAYLIDTSQNQYRQSGIDVLQQRNTNNNREILLLPQNIWRQTQENWESGAGQINLDRDDAIQSRFDSSYGIDPWNRWEFRLLPETEQLMDLSNESASVFLNVHDDNLVVAVEGVAHWFPSVSASATVLTVTTNTIIDSTYDGNEVVYLDSVGAVWKTPNSASAVVHVTEPGATFVEFTKDYLICGTGNVLRDITGVPTTIYTHPIQTFRWVDACAGPQAIYVVGSSADKSVVHRVGIKDDGTGLSPAIVAAELPDGEIGYSIGSYLGFVFIGTNMGVRMAIPDANGDLTLGSIIPTLNPVYDFEGQDRFVWFTKTSIQSRYVPVSDDMSNPFPDGSVCGLGRMDLSRFTVTAGTPAWANDIVAANEISGPELLDEPPHRNPKYLPPGTKKTQPIKTVSSVVSFQGKTVFAVNNGGVYFDGPNLMPGGWLVQGVISFSVEDLKAALYMNTMWKPSCQGRVFIDLAYDSAPFERAGTVTVRPDRIRSDNLNLFGRRFSRVTPRFVLNRCPFDTTKGPIITRWEIRSSPIKGRASRWEIPIVNHDEIEINGVKELRDPVFEKTRLVDLVQSGRVFIYQESNKSYQVMARDFDWRPSSISMNGSGWQGVFLLVVEEVL
jgi:hypothetical protein